VCMAKITIEPDWAEVPAASLRRLPASPAKVPAQPGAIASSS
jgi:hypothetical protein